MGSPSRCIAKTIPASVRKEGVIITSKGGNTCATVQMRWFNGYVRYGPGVAHFRGENDRPGGLSYDIFIGQRKGRAAERGLTA